MLEKISTGDIDFEPASIVDNVGKVFWWNGQVFRAISHENEGFYRELIEKKNIQDLFSRGLVPAEVAHFVLDGYGLVLKHKRIPFASFCMEWSSEMLRDAALLTCDLSIELYDRGLTLKDAHPWNILFDAKGPVFVDWGSIDTRERVPAWPYFEFFGWFMLPLYLMAAGKFKLARLLMGDVLYRPSCENVFRLLIMRIPMRDWLRYLLEHRTIVRTRLNPDPAFFKSLRRRIEKIPITEAHTEWTAYQGPDVKFSHQPSEKWPIKMRNVHRLLQRLQPRTVLDIGSNRGWFSELAALQGVRVVAIDVDEHSINTLYRRTRRSGLTVHPLVMDVCTPTPAHGIMQCYPDAQTRLQSDLVLALALTHHLVFKRGLAFEAIAKQLAAFTKRWLIVEFVPAEDRYVSEWMSERFGWYHLDGFTKALQEQFRLVEAIDSSPPPRVLLLCEK